MGGDLVGDLYGDDHPVLEPSLHIDYTILDDDRGVPGRPALTHHQVATKTTTDADIRCQGQVAIRNDPGEFRTCGKLLAKLAGRPWVMECPRCKTVNRSPLGPDQSTTVA